MRIVVNHLTRMQKGYICVAGVDLATGRHVRPLTHGCLRTRDLLRHGGLFDIGCVVDLGRARMVGRPPEIEDHFFRPHNACRLPDLPADQFWQMLERQAKPTLRDLFGPDLLPRGRRSCGVEAGKGRVSLGCLRAGAGAGLSIRRRPDGHAQVRIELKEGEFDLDLGVTDIRLYGPDHVTPDPEAVRRAARRLAEAPEVLLSVGLTRPFTPCETLPPVHWLQVNNLHFRDAPCWQLGGVAGSDCEVCPAL